MTRRHIRARQLCILAVVGLTILCAADRQANAVELHFNPGVVYADSADVFTIAVDAADVDSLRGYTLEFTFDDEALAFIDAEPGDLFSDYSPPYGLYWSEELLGGQLSLECLIIPSDECVAGPGEILVLTFEALGNHEETALEITAASVRDCQGVPIEPVTWDGAQIVLGPQAMLFFNPDPKYVLGSQHPCRISMEVDATDSLRGFQVYLQYDPTMVSFDSALVGNLLITDPPSPLWWYVLEESPEIVRVEGVILEPDLFVDGPGELIDLHFTGLVDFDTTEVIFHEWHVWDVNATEFYPVEVDTGLIILDAALQSIEPTTSTAEGGQPQLRFLSPHPGGVIKLSCRNMTGADIQAAVFDPSGRCVRRLQPRPVDSNQYEIEWDTLNKEGRKATSGVYWIRVWNERSAVTRSVMVGH